MCIRDSIKIVKAPNDIAKICHPIERIKLELKEIYELFSINKVTISKIKLDPIA